MKILHIMTFLTLDYQGGIQNYVRNLAIAQVKSGNEVHILTEIGSKSDDPSLHIHEVKTRKFNDDLMGAGRDKKHIAELKRLLDKEQFDIIHVHMVLGFDWRALQLLKNHIYIVSLHDYLYLCPRIQMIDNDKQLCTRYDKLKCRKCISFQERYRINRGIIKALGKPGAFIDKKLCIPQRITDKRFITYKKFLENATLLLPVSTRVEEIYKQSGISNTYYVSHIGNITADSFSEDYHFDDKEDRKICVAMIGTLSFNKGAELFLRLSRECQNKRIEFHFWGKSSVYKERAFNCNIIDHGPYNQKELSAILSNVDVGLVLPVWEDNAPQVVMEFLNNHVPVLGSRMGGISDFVDDMNGFLFNPYSEEEVQGAITFLNELNIEKIGSLKRNIKRTKTTKEHEQEMLNIYERLIVHR